MELMGGEIGVSDQQGGDRTFQQAPSNKICRILLAEDAPDSRILIEHYLRSEPVKLRFAVTGREALDAVRGGERFDLILMDIDMPVLDGFRAARAIRAWETLRGTSTPIVALSADAMSDVVRSSLDAGCVAHLAKPVDRDTLLKTIQRYASVQGPRSVQAAPAKVSTMTIPVSEQVLALVPQFLATKHTQINEARESLQSRDFAPIRGFGHNLKGTGRGYGFPAIEDLGREIENAATEANADRIAQLLDALHRVVTASAAAVADRSST